MPFTLDADAAYLALTARDARFDGRLIVGVTSTGIYCRPICRVRTPLRRNCRFFETPAQAEAASFRPCLKCRPEIAPGAGLAWTVMEASRTLARQAANALDARTGGHDDDATPESPDDLAGLARRLGVSDRHLRRIFQTEHGVSPRQYLQTRRLLLAKQLLTDTRLPVAQVALASGFGSLRRFNAAFAVQYRMSPGRLRGDSDGHGNALAGGTIELKLGYRPPYDVDRLLHFVARRAVPGVEVVHGRKVRRTLRAGTLAPRAGWLEVEFEPLRSRVRLRLPEDLAGASARIVAAVRRWLDLDAAPEAIDAALVDLPGDPGLRLPGGVDAFELAVRAVLGQQVTVAAARTLSQRLADRHGTPVATPWPEVDRCFPAPEALAQADPAHIGGLGIIRGRAGAIVALARTWPQIVPLLAPGAAAEPLIDALCALPGIGPWTAHYIAMRALGWPDAFLPGDVAVAKAMRLSFGAETPRAAEALARQWQPWRSYAVLRLWDSLVPAQSRAPASHMTRTPTS